MTTRNRRSEIPEGYDDLSNSTALAHVAPIGPQGEPSQTFTNLNRDPRIAFSIADPENPYRYLEVRGEVERVEEVPDIDSISTMAKNYGGVDRHPNHQPGDEGVVVFVKPRRTTRMGA